MVNLSFDLNVAKDSSNTNESSQNGGTSKSVTFEIHHGGCFTPTPSRSYVGGQVSSVNVVDIDEFCLHDLKDMVSSKPLSIGEVMKILSKKEPTSYVEGPIVVESDDPFEDLDEILGDYENTEDEITGKHMVVHVGNSSTVDDVLNLHMLFETEGVGPIGKFKKVKDLDYDPKHDDVFDDDEHIVKDVHVSMNNFNFTPDPIRDLSIGAIEFQKHDPYVIDYDSFGSDLDDIIDSKRRTQLRELRRISKQKKRIPIKRVRVRCEWTSPALVPNVASDTDMGKNVFYQTKGGPVTRENIISGNQNILGKDKIVQGKGKKIGGPWPGQILTAVGVDENNGIYPVAYAIVKADCKASWCWFLNLLGEDLAIASVFPSVEHMYYVRHIHENMKSQFKGCVYKEMLWNAAKATSVGEINKKMGELKSYNSTAYDWLMKIPAEQWSRSHF
ncbi:hypothetical protein Tco_1447058 [Tanacetum coccineum]